MELIHFEAAARARTGAWRPDFARFFGTGMALAVAILNAEDSEIRERRVCAAYLERANRNRKCDRVIFTGRCRIHADLVRP